MTLFSSDAICQLNLGWATPMPSGFVLYSQRSCLTSLLAKTPKETQLKMKMKAKYLKWLLIFLIIG